MDDEANVLQRGKGISYYKIYVTSVYCGRYFTILKAKSYFFSSG